MKVKLQEVMEALEGAGMEIEYYYDIKTQATRGKGAFRRFKDRLFDLGMEQEWYKYKDVCYEKIAREWCEKYGITVEI